MAECAGCAQAGNTDKGQHNAAPPPPPFLGPLPSCAKSEPCMCFGRLSKPRSLCTLSQAFLGAVANGVYGVKKSIHGHLLTDKVHGLVDSVHGLLHSIHSQVDRCSILRLS